MNNRKTRNAAAQLVLTVFCLASAQAQTGGTDGGRVMAQQRDNSLAVTAGLNINLVAAPKMTDFINAMVSPSDRVNTFGTGVEFFGGVEFPISLSWGVKADYGYLFKSYTLLPQQFSQITPLFYSVHMPSVLLQYVIPGTGYFIKFAGGGGYHFGRVEYTDPLSGTMLVYRAKGAGLKAEAAGQTALSKDLYVHIGGTLRWEMLGTVKDDSGNELTYVGATAGMSMFSAGFALGVAYYF
jgi:hypothetical protein